jgi:uncharacterized coiled-coil protein SlyX
LQISKRLHTREAFTQGLIEHSEHMVDEVYEELSKVLVYLKTLYNKMRE